jgi:hypothetical protein
VLVAHWTTSPRVEYVAPHKCLFRANLSCVFYEGTANTNFIYFGFIRSGSEATIYHTRGEHANWPIQNNVVNKKKYVYSHVENTYINFIWCLTVMLVWADYSKIKVLVLYMTASLQGHSLTTFIIVTVKTAIVSH